MVHWFRLAEDKWNPKKSSDWEILAPFFFILFMTVMKANVAWNPMWGKGMDLCFVKGIKNCFTFREEGIFPIAETVVNL